MAGATTSPDDETATVGAPRPRFPVSRSPAPAGLRRSPGPDPRARLAEAAVRRLNRRASGPARRTDGTRLRFRCSDVKPVEGVGVWSGLVAVGQRRQRLSREIAPPQADQRGVDGVGDLRGDLRRDRARAGVSCPCVQAGSTNAGGLLLERGVLGRRGHRERDLRGRPVSRPDPHEEEDGMRNRFTRWRATGVAAGALLALLALPGGAAAQAASEDQLRAALAAQMAQGPAASGAYVVDLADGHVVFEHRRDEKLLSASVTKLYTTATALLHLGPRARVATRVLGEGRRRGGTWNGDLYLRGGGDFTFGTAAFSRKAYGSRASVEHLAARLRRSGLRRIRGDVLGDATLYSDNGGSPFNLVLCSNPCSGATVRTVGRQARAADPNGPRTPIGFNRGLRSATGAEPRRRRRARLHRARADPGLGERRIRVDEGTPAPGARLRGHVLWRRLATRRSRGSSRWSTGRLTTTQPTRCSGSVGARVAGDGSGAGGAGVVSDTIKRAFGLAPEIETGSARRSSIAPAPHRARSPPDRHRRDRPEGRPLRPMASQAGRNGTLLGSRGASRKAAAATDGAGSPTTSAGEHHPQHQRLLQERGAGQTYAFAVIERTGMPVGLHPGPTGSSRPHTRSRTRSSRRSQAIADRNGV